MICKCVDITPIRVDLFLSLNIFAEKEEENEKNDEIPFLIMLPKDGNVCQMGNLLVTLKDLG